MKHSHWKIIAYNEMKDGNYIEPVQVTVNDCFDEDCAIKKARLMITRNNYVLRETYECNQCQTSKSISDFLKKMN